MGVFEYGELNGSIHFHSLIYIPEGGMIGELVKKREYSTKRGGGVLGMEILSLTSILGCLIFRK